MATTVWKGHLAFGLVSIPVRLYRAARKERIRLHYLAPSRKADVPVERSLPSLVRAVPSRTEYQDPEEEYLNSNNNTAEPEKFYAPASVSRITQAAVCNEDREPITRSEIIRGHEVAPDRYVTFGQEELRGLRLKTSPEMTIVRSVRLEEIDPVYFETSYYVVPDAGGERAYSLLFLALKDSHYVGLATVVMHGREHVVVIRPGRQGLLGHTMFYEDEVHAKNEFDTKISDVAQKEVQLAKTFVEAIAGPFAPEEFKDTWREKMTAMVSAKLSRGEVASLETPSEPVTATRAVAPVVDIMEALKKSIEATKKPTPREIPVQRREPGSVTAMKGKPRKRRA